MNNNEFLQSPFFNLSYILSKTSMNLPSSWSCSCCLPAPTLWSPHIFWPTVCPKLNVIIQNRYQLVAMINNGQRKLYVIHIFIPLQKFLLFSPLGAVSTTTIDKFFLFCFHSQEIFKQILGTSKCQSLVGNLVFQILRYHSFKTTINFQRCSTNTTSFRTSSNFTRKPHGKNMF